MIRSGITFVYQVWVAATCFIWKYSSILRHHLIAPFRCSIWHSQMIFQKQSLKSHLTDSLNLSTQGKPISAIWHLLTINVSRFSDIVIWEEAIYMMMSMSLFLTLTTFKSSTIQVTIILRALVCTASSPSTIPQNIHKPPLETAHSKIIWSVKNLWKTLS